MSEEICYKISESTTKKGLGMFATRKITRGQLILSEKPLIAITETVRSKREVDEKISKLNSEKKQIFFSLYDCYTPENPTAFGIIKTNALQIDSGHGGVFPNISRINHSCLPNVHHFWSEKDKLEKVFAIKNIDCGEEILTSYIDLYADRATRQEKLKENFKFICKCHLCSIQNPIEINKSDSRRRALFKLDQEIPIIASINQEMALVKANQVLQLLKEEGMEYEASYLGRISYDIFSILYQTTQQNLKYWARQTLDNYMLCQGEFTGRLKDVVYYYYNK